MSANVDSADAPEASREGPPDIFPRTAASADGLLLNDLLSDLATCYPRYRRALSVPLDPVMTMTLVGDVLQSVRTLLTAIGQASGHCPTSLRKAWTR